MNIQHIQQLYGDTSQATALLKALKDTEAKSIFLKGLVASAAPVFFLGWLHVLSEQCFLFCKTPTKQVIFIMT